MSLARIAVRIAAVEALKGRTQVEGNVLDSRIGALDMAADGSLRTDQDKPFIAVYTDAATATDDLGVRALNQNGVTEILFEMGVTAAMTETNDNGDSHVIGIGIPATDRGLEFSLDMMIRQIAVALTDPDNIWAEIFRNLVVRIVKIERARVGNAADGVRLAGQQLKITAELIEDPVVGELLDPASPLQQLFDAVNAGDDIVLKAQIAFMAGTIGTEGEDWEKIQARLGMTRGELLAIGLGPISGDEDQETPDFTDAEVEIPAHGTTEIEPEL